MTILDEPPVTRVRPAGAPLGAGVCRVPLLEGQAFADYRRRGRWAIAPGGVNAPAGGAELALSEYLDVLRERRLRPLFVDVADPTPYARRGFSTHPHGRTALLALPHYGIAAADPALRRELAAAGRAGLLVVPRRPAHASQLARFAPAALSGGAAAEAWVAVGPEGEALGVAVWVPGPEPSGDSTEGAGPAATRVLSLVAAQSRAPESVRAFLIADAVEEYRRRGVHGLYLGGEPAACWWPAPGGPGATRLPPALARFGPRWEHRWLALPSDWLLPAAAWALRRRRSGHRA